MTLLKRINYLAILCILLVNCVSSKNENDTSVSTKENLKNLDFYLFYDFFSHIEVQKIQSVFEKYELIDDIYPGYENITFNIYGSNLNRSIKLKINKEDDLEDIHTKIQAFFISLKDEINIEKKDILILDKLSEIYNDIEISQNKSSIILHSDLIENSGGPINDTQSEESWNDGQFRFIENVDGINYCVPDHIEAAKKQLDNQNSWIFENIIKKSEKISKISKIYIIHPKKIKCYRNKKFDYNDIGEFWTDLFHKCNIIFRKEPIKSIEDFEFF